MTRDARVVWAAAFDLVWKVGVIVIAVVLCTLTPPAGVTDAPESPTPAGGSVQTDAGLFGDDVRVTLDVPEGRSLARCSLRDGEGKELARITYSRTGTITFVLDEAFPTRAGAIASPDGTYRLEVGHAGASYRLRIQPGGASGFAVDHRRLGIRSGLGFTPEGELIHDPAVID
jgi:hypothetical protein